MFNVQRSTKAGAIRNQHTPYKPFFASSRAIAIKKKKLLPEICRGGPSLSLSGTRISILGVEKEKSERANPRGAGSWWRLRLPYCSIV
jgi:hypothetical protein